MKQLADLSLVVDGDVVRATVTGELDLSNVHEVESSLREALRNTAVGVVLDLGEVEFLDSVGVEMLLRLAIDLARRQQKLAVVAPDDSVVARVLEVSGAGSTLERYDTDATARAAVTGLG